MGGQLEQLQGGTARALEQVVTLHPLVAGPSAEALEAVELVLAALEAQNRGVAGSTGAVAGRLRQVLGRFRELAGRSEQAAAQIQVLQGTLSDLARHLRDDTHYQAEVMVLEERMRVVSETGSALLQRLQGNPSISSSG
jgi:NAD(P)H-dependent flavin oxidoreductase YrpB (nitropropane dioxygenase family)